MELDELIARLEKATEWRAVLGWPYEASNTGIIRNAKTKKPLRPSLTSKGYEHVMFSVDGVRRTVRVHCIVAEAWFGTVPNGHQVNHKDGCKTNNCPQNLEYVTPAQNMRHAVTTGLMASGDRNGVRTKPERVARGSRAARAKLSDQSVIEIRRKRRAGARLKALSTEYGVDESLISQICRRKIWTHI